MTSRATVGPSAHFRIEPLERRVLLAAGGFDSSFSDDGRTTVDFGPNFTVSARAAAVQPDGRTVVVGRAWPTGPGRIGFAVARLNLDGSLDTTFGPTRNGTAVTYIGDESEASAVAIQPDGKIVVVGTSNDSDFAVARYNANGTIDTSFDGDGIRSFDFSTLINYSRADEVLIQQDGRILIGGTTDTSLLGSNSDFALARLHPNGSFDSSFGGDGRVVVGFGGSDYFTAMAINYNDTPATNPDYGKIVAVGGGGPGGGGKLLVIRLHPNGSRDQSFSGDGELAIPYYDDSATYGVGVVIQPGGKIVAGGSAGFSPTTRTSGLVMARFLPNGSLDTTFGSSGDGWTFADFGNHSEPALDLISASDGGLILAGTNQDNFTPDPSRRDVLAFYTADGRPDTRYPGGGKVALPFNGGQSLAHGPGKRFVFAAGPGFHTARLLEAGANLVNIASLDSVATEAGETTAGVIIFREERVPVEQRVYFSVGGTARSPVAFSFPPRPIDYTGIDSPRDSDIIYVDTGYVDIPANSTFVSFVITAVNDSAAEGNETVVLTLLDRPYYDVGTPSAVRLTIVDDDAPPPTVAEVYVRGTSWAGADNLPENTTFQEFLGASGLGHADLGFRIDNAPAGSTIPWVNVNQIVLRYASPPTGSGIPSTGTIVVDGVRSDYSATAVTQLDARTYAVTLDRALGDGPAGGNDGDRIRLAVAGGAGGPYELRFNVVQGDVNRSGSVLANDYSEVKARFFRNTNAPGAGANPYTPFHDVDASGSILANDYSAVKSRFFDALPPASPPALELPPSLLFATGSEEDKVGRALL